MPQTRLSSKGLAYVSLSTAPTNPVSGQLTIILIQFSDPQTKTPLVDLYYNFIIRNQIGPVLTVPQATTITGGVGIPFQFEKPGNYQVEIDLNSTTSQTNSSHLDEVTFPLYVAQREAHVTNQTATNVIPQNIPTVNTKSNRDTTNVLVDGVLLAVGVGIALFIIRRKVISRRKNLDVSK